MKIVHDNIDFKQFHEHNLHYRADDVSCFCILTLASVASILKALEF